MLERYCTPMDVFTCLNTSANFKHINMKRYQVLVSNRDLTGQIFIQTRPLSLNYFGIQLKRRSTMPAAVRQVYNVKETKALIGNSMEPQYSFTPLSGKVYSRS